VLALVIWPWANQQTQELKDRYGSRGDLERVAPGQFQESASGRRVFFLDKDTPDNKSGKNIFISTVERGKRRHVGAHRPGGDRRRQPVPAAVQRPAAGELAQGRRQRISEFEERQPRRREGLGSQDDAPAKTRPPDALMATRRA
jgi:lipopolysaccharide export system permease protein